MRNFLILYGKIVIVLGGIAVFLFVLSISFRKEWNEYGIVKNVRQKYVSSKMVLWEKPVLDVMNKRLVVGEAVSLSQWGRARDSDGTDLAKNISYEDENGKKLPALWRADKAGVYRIVVSVKSPVTQKENRKKILFLVDSCTLGKKIAERRNK